MAAITDNPGGTTLVLPARTTHLVLLLCFLTIVTEGYDIGVMGTIVPSLLADPVWKLTPIEIGAMSSAALFGTLFGSYFISVLSDLIGRKRLLIGCVALFSVSMIGAAWASTPVIFSAMRFVGGIGLGGVISAAAALTVEYSPAAKKNLNFALMYSGYAIGALISALAGMAFLGSHDWRFVVALGGLPLIAVPALMIWLPESLDYLIATGRIAAATRLAEKLGVGIDLSAHSARLNHVKSAPKASIGAVFREVFSKDNIGSTICLWIAQITAVLVIYGLGTWLPQLMRKMGYDLGSSLSFLAVFMLSSAVGGILIGQVSDRVGVRKTIILGYVIGALAISGLTIKGSLLSNYVLVALAGAGSIGVAMVQLGYIANFYKPFARASATGWAVGIGRFGAMAGPMVGAYFAASGADVKLNFFAFAASGLIAGIMVTLTKPRQHTLG